MTTTDPALPPGWHAHWMEKPCPLARCGAKAGEPCRMVGNRRMAPEWPHVERYRPTKEERKAAYAVKQRAYEEHRAEAERQREEERRQERAEWPDGRPENADPRTWVRQITQDGGGVHWFSGERPHDLQPYALARVADTGRSFRWEVSNIDGRAFDEGYARTLSGAKAKAEKCYEEEVAYYKGCCAAERATRADYLK